MDRAGCRAERWVPSGCPQLSGLDVNGDFKDPDFNTPGIMQPFWVFASSSIGVRRSREVGGYCLSGTSKAQIERGTYHLGLVDGECPAGDFKCFRAEVVQVDMEAPGSYNVQWQSPDGLRHQEGTNMFKTKNVTSCERRWNKDTSSTVMLYPGFLPKPRDETGSLTGIFTKIHRIIVNDSADIRGNFDAWAVMPCGLIEGRFQGRIALGVADDLSDWRDWRHVLILGHGAFAVESTRTAAEAFLFRPSRSLSIDVRDEAGDEEAEDVDADPEDAADDGHGHDDDDDDDDEMLLMVMLMMMTMVMTKMMMTMVMRNLVLPRAPASERAVQVATRPTSAGRLFEVAAWLVDGSGPGAVVVSEWQSNPAISDVYFLLQAESGADTKFARLNPLVGGFWINGDPRRFVFKFASRTDGARSLATLSFFVQLQNAHEAFFHFLQRSDVVASVQKFVQNGPPEELEDVIGGLPTSPSLAEDLGSTFVGQTLLALGRGLGR
ncbi:hypothetical protein AK812_SmicGene15003 [Symbiodinium microadriaticum]|uniref:Uncharacterized protein n=1 Tax=Symbiodinium microadriaticum TaxID=2951 RepID=A0A1Q9E447_SYMMI|nr:hypothetical protein AK812_SmicGene15003 [Symbiodinium microadriaticum]